MTGQALVQQSHWLARVKPVVAYASYVLGMCRVSWYIYLGRIAGPAEQTLMLVTHAALPVLQGKCWRLRTHRHGSPATMLVTHTHTHTHTPPVINAVVQLWSYCLGLAPVGEVHPRGGVPGLGRGGEQGLGGRGRVIQVAWHGSVTCFGLGLPKLAQVHLTRGTTCTCSLQSLHEFQTSVACML